MLPLSISEASALRAGHSGVSIKSMQLMTCIEKRKAILSIQNIYQTRVETEKT